MPADFFSGNLLVNLKHVFIINIGQDKHIFRPGNRGASMGMLDSDGNSSDNGDNTLRKKKNTYIKSKELITYFAQLARSKNPTDTIDLKMVDRLIRNGANINITDKYGQTVMHEVAKNWHTDVAKYLIKRGAIYDAKDRYGRTPLHLASAVGHVEMIDYLVSQDQGMSFILLFLFMILFSIKICRCYFFS